MTAAPISPLFLLIDGNNLAHYLYAELRPGQKMTAALSARLIKHMGNYARHHPRALTVELFLDRPYASDESLPENLRILAAEHPRNADVVLLEQFAFHQYRQEACLVITNDDDLIEEVHASGGDTLRVYEFVRRPAPKPVFRGADELTPGTRGLYAIHLHKTHERPSARHLPPMFMRVTHARLPGQTQKAAFPRPLFLGRSAPIDSTAPAATAANAVTAANAATSALPFSHTLRACSAYGSPAADLLTQPVAETLQSPMAEPAQPKQASAAAQIMRYVIDPQIWPRQAGLRFLRGAFCPQHRHQHAALIASCIQAGEVQMLAELLVETCASETGFACRGSLSTRVRLALLQAHGQPLTLTEIACRTGLPPVGLAAQIKVKASRWVVRINPASIGRDPSTPRSLHAK